MLRVILSLNGREKEYTVNQNRLRELEDSGYVLERVIERIPNATNPFRESSVAGGAG